MTRTTMTALLCLALLSTGLAACGDDGTGLEAPGDVEWHQVSSAVGTIDVALLPPEAGTAGPHPVVFALPWGAGTRDLVLSLMGRYWDSAAPARGYYVVVPEVLGTSLAEGAGEVIPAIFRWMEEELDFDPGAVVVAGASNGGRGAFYSAVQQPARFSAVIGMPGYYSGPDQDLAALAGKPVWLMAGASDTDWVASATATRDALRARGIEVVLDVLPGQNHLVSVDQSVLMDWIDEALGR